MMTSATAFGVGVSLLPRLSLGAEMIIAMGWGGYDSDEYIQSFVAKHGRSPNYSIFSTEEDALSGRIAASVYLGDRNHFLVKVEGLEKPFAVALQNSARNLSDIHRDEANVWLSWAASAGVLPTE
jgi:hypothetical protein